MTASLRNALVSSAAILVTVVTVNLLSSPGFLWCVFPAFGIAWWPLSVSFSGKKQPLRFALWGTGLVSGLLIATYLLASPGAHPWFLYPLLGVFWWPLSVWGLGKGARAFSKAGGAYIIVTLLIVNLAASPGFGWWVYPAFFTLWWPVSVQLGAKAKTLSFAAGSAAAASVFLLIMHGVHTPGVLPWYLYAVLPFFWWPVSMLLQKRFTPLRIGLISVIVFAAYYTGLIALLHGVSDLLSVFGLAAAAWLVYAAVISKHRLSFPFAAANAALLAAYFVLVHRFITPDVHPWYWYTFFPLLCWPAAAALKETALKPLPVATCATAFLLYYGALNLFLSPAVPWVLFLAYPAAGAVIAAFCRQKRAWTTMSIWMSAAGIACFAAINLVFTPHTVWAVYPAFAILWWPMSMVLFGRKKKDEEA